MGDVYRLHLSKVLDDDIPSIVKEATMVGNGSSWQPDDVTFRSRPDTQYVLNRTYRRHAPVYSWAPVPLYSESRLPASYFTDFRTQTYTPVREASVQTTERKESRFVSSFQQSSTGGTRQSSLQDKSSGAPRHGYLLNDLLTNGTIQNGASSTLRSGYHEHSFLRGRYSVPGKKIERERPYFLSSILPSSYVGLSSQASAGRKNTEFPFKKYRSDFIPFAPYPRLYDTVQYTPNPDWSGYYGYRYRKARFTCCPEHQETSRSREIEHAMREARLRELCKGVYTSGYSQNIKNKAGLTDLDTISSKPVDEGFETLLKPTKSYEAELAPSESEKQRKHLSLADKRRRNETLAVGLTNSSLLKAEQVTRSSETQKEVTEKETLNLVNIEKKNIKGLDSNAEKSLDLAEPKCNGRVEQEGATPMLISDTVPTEVTERPTSPLIQQDLEDKDPKVEQNELGKKPDITEEIAEDETTQIELAKDSTALEDAKEEATELLEQEEVVEEQVVEVKPEVVQKDEKVVSEVIAPVETLTQTLQQEAEVTETDDKAPEGNLEISEPLIEPVQSNSETQQENNKETELENQSFELVNEQLDENTSKVDTTEENPTGEIVDEVEIKIVTETTTSNMIPDNVESTTAETITTLNEDGTETIETTITEYTKKADGDENTTIEATITTVTIKSSGEFDSMEAEQILQELDSNLAKGIQDESLETGMVVEPNILELEADQPEAEEEMDVTSE